MSTLTQFQQLTKPGYSDPADIAVINTNLDAIDKIGTVLCTNATRPTTNLFNGLQIYETDTKITYRYDGAAWRLVSDPNGWVPYTLVWTTTGTQPNIGNGTLFAAYKKLTEKTISLRAAIIPGTTTTFGTGSWQLSLPPGVQQPNNIESCMVGRAAAAGNIYPCIGVILANDTKINLQSVTSSTNNIMQGVDPTHPGVWAANSSNYLNISGVMETQ